MVILKTNLKFNILVENVNFYNQSKEDTMVKKAQSGSVFDSKTSQERSDYMRDNPGVMLSATNFHMLFQIYKAACKNQDAKYNEICKRYTKKVNK